MDSLDDMLQGVLSDPSAMEKLKGLAQSFGITPPVGEANGAPPPSGPDLSAVKQLSGIMQKASLDQKQQTLLSALSPYMSSTRIGKLQRAMQAAKVAELTKDMLGPNRPGSGHV